MNLLLEILVVLWEYHKAFFIAIYHTIVTPKEKSVRGEIVLITGAGSGLGRLMCQRFAERGAVVVACDVNKKGNNRTAEIVREAGGKIHTYVCDVSKKENVYALADDVRKDVGDVTILVNNAGIVTGKRFLDCSDNMIQKTMEVNLLAHFWTVKTFLPSMMRANHGHIVNIASIAGVVGTTCMTDYCASKFGNVGFTESLDYELVADNHTGIKTTTVCPYFINTGMFDGCNTRFPRLLPVLDPNDTTEKIIHAVLINQKILYIPKIMYLVSIMKALLPVEACIVLHKFTGATTFMDSFIGRQKTKAE